MLKCLTHVGHGERELTVLRSGLRLILKASEGVLPVREQDVGDRDMAGFPLQAVIVWSPYHANTHSSTQHTISLKNYSISVNYKS